MSRIVRFHRTGGPEVLQIDHLDVPAPRAGEVRIAVKALGLNRAEAQFRAGHYVEEPRLPGRLGYEAAGTVESLGEGVTGFGVGDAVSVVPAFSMNDYGMYGDLVLAPARAVVKHPASLSWEEAASVWMQYATGYGVLIDLANLQARDAVLITAASSSAGLAAIQIANLVGATSVALTRTRSKRQALLDIGAAHVIVTEEDDLVAEVKRLTGGKGARVVLDAVGGPLLAKLAEAASEYGTVFSYGALSTEVTPLPIFEMVRKRLTVRGYQVFEVTMEPARLDKAKRFIVDGLAARKLRPMVAKTFPFEEIFQAHRYLEGNQQIGKVVVNV